MATFGACYCVFDDDQWLPSSLESIYPVTDAICILVSNRPWNGPQTDNAKTLSCLERFPDPEKKLQVIRGDWTTEVEQRNLGAAILTKAGFDYKFIIDADEVYDTEQLAAMMAYAASKPEINCWHAEFVVYWKSPRYRIDPPEKHHPPIFLKLGSGGFVEYRNCVTDSHGLIPPEVGVCHHLSYARTDEQVLKKISSFSHSDQVRENWFEKTWKAWDIDQSITDLNPYNPGVFHRAVEMDNSCLPPVLRRTRP